MVTSKASVRATLLGLAVVVGSCVVTAGVASPAAATQALTDPVSLPLTDVTDAVADPTHQVLYVSGAPGDHDNAVVSPDGQTIDQIPVIGARRLALSPDGATLYAAVPDGIETIDTATYDAHLVAGGTCIRELAVVGDLLWYLADGGCDDQDAQLDVYDPTTEQVTFKDSLGSFDNGRLEAVPGHHELLVGSSHGATVIHTDGPTVGTIRPDLPLDRLHDVFVDGGATLLSQTGTAYSLPDLTPTGHVGLPGGFDFLFGGEDQYLLGGGQQGLGLFDRSTMSLLRTISIGGSAPPDRVDRELFVDGTFDVLAVDSGHAQLYVDTTPAAPAPDLTETVTDPVALHAATISGTLTDQGMPLDGVTVRVVDENGQPIGTAVTDPQGAWSLTHTYSAIGFQVVQAESDPVSGHKRAYSRLVFEVQQPGFDLTAPASVAPHELIDVQGRARSVDDPVANSTVDWAAYCGNRSPFDTGQRPTGADGTFTLSVDPGDCVHVRVALSWGTGTTARFDDAHVDVLVTWKVAQLSLDLPGPVYVGDTVSGSVTDVLDGSPLAGVPVTVTVQGPGLGVDGLDLSGTTDAQGKVPVEFTPTLPGDYSVGGISDSTSDTITIATNGAVYAQDIATSITATAAPTELKIGDGVAVSGDITRAHGPIDGVSLRLVAIDNGLNASRRELHTTTDDQGHFVFHDTPGAIGSTTYQVSFDGEGALYPPSSTSALVAVAIHHSQVTITTDHPSYDAGDIATIHIDLSDSPDRTVMVGWLPDGTTANGGLLFNGSLPEGGLTLHRQIRFDQTFVAITNDTTSQVSDRDSVSVTARLGLTTQLLDPVRRTSHGVAVYRVPMRPTVRAHAFPARAGACVRFLVERRGADGWSRSRLTGCHDLDTRGRATWRYDREPHSGSYRVRTLFDGDARHDASRSVWSRFRLR